MPKSNIQSISEATGYSISTVSRVLSGKAVKSRISRKAVELITAEARRVDYTPNMLAQGLRIKKTFTVGLIVPGIDNPFFATMASNVIGNLMKAGYQTLLVDSRDSKEDFINGLKMFMSRNVDGMIVVPVGTDPSYLENIASSIPVVLIDRYYENTTLPYVCTDNYEGGFMATEHLISRGYRRLLSIQGVNDSMPSRERLRGFKAAIDSHSELAIEYEVVGDAFSVENGYTQVKEMFKDGARRFDAVFAYSSTILLGAFRAFHELGIKVPDDVGIISYDNAGFLDFLNPSITRIEQPLVEIGNLASDMLLDLISKGPAEIKLQRFLRPVLTSRESC